ncbi:MAG: major tail protein [Acutalibacteraceae bacterium]|nr:major tail protein [Acutalibacteraceae bacterium]
MERPITYERYRGIKNAVIAKVTVDDEGNYTTGEVIRLMGATEISKDKKTSSETFFCDDLANGVTEATGETTIKVKGTIPSREVEAMISGVTYDKTNDAIIETPRTVSYFAFGYCYSLTDGTEILVWNFKGTFSVGTQNHKTKDDGTSSEQLELTYTGIDTIHKFKNIPDGENNTKISSARSYIVKATETITAEKFFTQVTTPDTISSITTTAAQGES